jgi:hypothetical protein
LSGVAEHDINCGCTTGLKFKSLKAISFEEFISKDFGSFDEWRIDKGKS